MGFYLKSTTNMAGTSPVMRQYRFYATAAPNALERYHEQQRRRGKQADGEGTKEEQQGKQQCALKLAYPCMVSLHKTPFSCSDLKDKEVALVKVPKVDARASRYARPAPWWRGVTRPTGVFLMLQLLFVGFVPVRILFSLNIFPPLLQPVSGVSWPVLNTPGSPMIPLLLPLLCLPVGAAGSSTPSPPEKPAVSTSGDASAAVKTRWDIWRQRVGRPENVHSPPDAHGEEPADESLIGGNEQSKRSVSPTSQRSGRSGSFTVPLPVEDGTLIQSGGNLFVRPPQKHALPEESDTWMIHKSPATISNVLAISGTDVNAAGTSHPYTVKGTDKKKSSPVGAAQDRSHTSPLTPLRAAPVAGALAVVAQRIAPSLRAVLSDKAAGNAGTASVGEKQTFAPTSDSDIRERAASESSTPSVSPDPQSSIETLHEEESPEHLLTSPTGWLSPAEGMPVPYIARPYKVEECSARSRASHLDGENQYSATLCGRKGEAAVAGDGIEGAVESPYTGNVRPKEQQKEELRQGPELYEGAEKDLEKKGQSMVSNPLFFYSSKEKPQQGPGDPEAVLLLGHREPSPQEHGVDSTASFGGRLHEQEQNVVRAKLEEGHAGQGMSGQWNPTSTGRPHTLDFGEWRHLLQRQRQQNAPGARRIPEQHKSERILVPALTSTKQQEAEEYFGQGTTVQLLKTRRDFEAFIRQEVVQHDKVAVILFFGRLCPYCMMFKGIFSQAAKRVAAELGTDNTVFAAKEVVFYEEDFADDDDLQGQPSIGGKEDTTHNLPKKPVAEPVEATLGVMYIPQVRIFAPLHRTKQRPAVAAVGSSHISVSKQTEGADQEIALEDRGIIAASPATEEPEWDEPGERGRPKIYWLPAVRKKESEARPSSIIEAGGRAPSEASTAVATPSAPYWSARLGHSDLSEDGIYQYLVEQVDFGPVPSNLNRQGEATDVVAVDAATPVKQTPQLPIRAATSTTTPSPLRQIPPAPPTSPLRVVTKVLHAIAAECSREATSALQVQSVRHEALCSGSSRWDAVEERETPVTLRLHDALSTLVFVLKRWVPMAGKGDRLSRENEAVLLRFLEVCRYVFPWREVKEKLFSLQMLLHTKGSGAEPIFWQWRKPGFLKRQESAGGRGGVGASGSGAVSREKEDRQQASENTFEKQWGWWNNSVEDAVEKAAEAAAGTTYAAVTQGKTKVSKTGSKPSSNGTSDETNLPSEAPAAVMLKQAGGPCLRKAMWNSAVRSLELLGIGGAVTPSFNEPQIRDPRLLQCETLLCGVWTLFHTLAEGAAVTFRNRVRRAAQQAAAKEETSAKTRRPRSDEARRDSVDIQFYTAQDNLGVYTTRGYMELLRKEARSRRDAPPSPASNRRDKPRKKGSPDEEDISYMISVLEEQFGAVASHKALKAFVDKVHRLHNRMVFPAALIQQVLRDFIEQYLSCYSCRLHFLQCYHRGFFGARDVIYPASAAAAAAAAYNFKRGLVLQVNTAAPRDGEGPLGPEAQEAPYDKDAMLEIPAAVWRPPPVHDRPGLTSSEAAREKKNFLHLRLWLWRLHNAVNIRSAAEATRAMAAEYPDLFLTKEELENNNQDPSHPANARAAVAERDEMLKDYSPLRKKSLGVGYYVNVDPRWPLRSTCPECRIPVDPVPPRPSNGQPPPPGAARTSWRTKDFSLTPEYLLRTEKEDDICINSDFLADFNLKEVKHFLTRTYWATDRHPFPCMEDSDIYFNYEKHSFVQRT